MVAVAIQTRTVSQITDIRTAVVVTIGGRFAFVGRAVVVAIVAGAAADVAGVADTVRVAVFAFVGHAVGVAVQTRPGTDVTLVGSEITIAIKARAVGNQIESILRAVVVYDTLEMEANLYDVEEVVHRALDQLDPNQTWSSETITRTIGRILHQNHPGEGVLKSAYRQGVPVYIPAFTDSEMGLDLSFWAMRRALREGRVQANGPDGKPVLADLLAQLPPFNPYQDLQGYAHNIVNASRTGIFTIGGGVPRNWAQQVGPYIDFMAERLGIAQRVPRFHYAVRLCPEPTHWGGLSGSTYAEGISWGKFVPPEEGGRFAEVYADATVVLPLLVQGLLEVQRLSPTPPRKSFHRAAC